MGRGSYEPNLEAYLDTPEKIQQCLHCPRPKCNGCKTGRRGHRVIVIAADGTRKIYESVRSAARKELVSESWIRKTIGSGQPVCGVRWIYDT